MAEMPAKLRERALAAMDVGRATVFPIILSPSRASARFHNGTSLLVDWDTFNMKPASKPSETSSGGDDREYGPDLRSLKRASPLKCTESTVSPKKKKALLPDCIPTSTVTPTASTSDAVVQQISQLLAAESKQVSELQIRLKEAEKTKLIEWSARVEGEFAKVNADAASVRTVKSLKDDISKLQLEVARLTSRDLDSVERGKKLEQQAEVRSFSFFQYFHLGCSKMPSATKF